MVHPYDDITFGDENKGAVQPKKRMIPNCVLRSERNKYGKTAYCTIPFV